MSTRRIAVITCLGLIASVAPWVVATPVPAGTHIQSSGDVVEIEVGDNFFKPKTLEIAPGTTVRWTNEGRNLHNVRPDKGTEFGLKRLPSGDTYEYTFEEPGRYGYYCSFHGAPDAGQYGTIKVTGEAGAGGAGADADAGNGTTGTIRVPQDAKTIQAAVDQAAPGALVLVSPGVYPEAVTVTTPRLVVRGTDRNRVILDGEFQAENGVKVVDADGVAVENMTARNYVGNGFFWTGVDGYRGSYLTAYRNGDYGVYAFDSVNGQFDHSYASGSPDSGFYIGQCRPCNAVVSDVISEYNELGYSGTNASENLAIVNSVWRYNRAGIVPNSLDSEELPPQGDNLIAGNLVYENQSTKAATSPTAEFDAVFGVGIAIVGGTGNEIVKNRVLDQERVGIVLAPNPGIQENVWPAQRNQVRDNVVERSGTVDLGMLATTAADANCFSGNRFTTSAPSDVEQVAPCDGTGTGDFATGALDPTPYLDTSKNPPGRLYEKTPVPPKQPNLPRAKTAKARAATHEPTITVTVAKIRVPKPPQG